MSGSLAEIEAVAKASGHQHDYSPQPSPQGDSCFDLDLTPLAARREAPPFSDTEIAIENQVRKAIKSFSEFPSGLHFPDRIFYNTWERVTDEHGRSGVRIITADKNGEIAMVEAYEDNEWGEWDISPDYAKKVYLTSSDIRCYAESLLDTMSMRFTEPRLRVAKETGDVKRIFAINEDLAAIKATKQAISDLLAKAAGNSAPAPATTPR